MTSIYTGEDISRIQSPDCSCALCSELALEIVDGIPLCAIPGNHPDKELEPQA